ncbi:MAG: cyclic pyranopterin monophosphate synthase MoaC [Nitrospirae bacterium]|nr:cyclic pyranopterin monophosphate synthase MoaC [Nitrospirota bacterium]
MPLSHLNESGRARMVDITGKPQTQRTAMAAGKVYLKPETLRLIQKGGVAKGDVLTIARVAGIMAAKQVPNLIPLCHPLLLTGVEVSFKEDPNPDDENRCGIAITSTVRTAGQTGVEMEAMAAVCAAALTIYDMCKSADREMSFGEIMLVSKSGGKSGSYTREVKGKK